MSEVELKDLTSLIARGVSPKYAEADGIPVINQKCIRNGQVNLNLARLHNTEKKFHDEKKLCTGDVLINSTGVGTAGRVGYWDNNYLAIVDTHVSIVRANQDVLYPKYLFYALFGREQEIESYAEGSTGQVELSRHKIGEITIFNFPLPEQKAIADVLSVLDDKIDLLQRQNETLEKMAETLFRQWFIEEAKEDWEVYKVSDIADHMKTNIKPNLLGTETFKHYSLPAFDNGKMALMELGSSILSNKYIVANQSILVSKLNPRVSRVWLILDSTKNDICSTEFQNLCPKNNQHLSFLYSLFKSNDVVDHLSMSASGTSGSHQRVRPEDMLNIEFSTPSMEFITEYSNLIKPFLEKQHQNLQAFQILQNLRDTLLPKLMSGEVRVNLD